MATQICPKCKQGSYTWRMDDEISGLTIWSCYKCDYQACEDESYQRKCKICGKTTKSKLKDSEKEYWWCSNCNEMEIIKNYT